VAQIQLAGDLGLEGIGRQDGHVAESGEQIRDAAEDGAGGGGWGGSSPFEACLDERVARAEAVDAFEERLGCAAHEAAGQGVDDHV
jgi:hypothetical protein